MKNMIFIFIALQLFINLSYGQESKSPDSLNLMIKGIVNEHYYSNEYVKGLRDAIKFYKPKRSQGNVVLISSIINPVVGLVPAIYNSKSLIEEVELGYPNESEMNNADYYYAYTSQANKLHKKYIWRKWANGSLVGVLVVGAVIFAGYSTTF